MSQPHKHTKAVNFLIGHDLPTPEQIDAMGMDELAKFMTQHGVNIATFQKEMSAAGAQIEGKLRLRHARTMRMKLDQQRPSEADLSGMPLEAIKAALLGKYGSFEQLPIAARNHKAMNRVDWESLYRDTMMPH